MTALAFEPLTQGLPHNNAGWLLRNAAADARERVWSHPALMRLQDSGLRFEQYTETTLRLLLAYRHAEACLDAALPSSIEGLAHYVPRAPLLERDLEALGGPVPHPRAAPSDRMKGRAVYLGIRCGLAEIESGADAVARRLWRFHPELWSNAADFWRYLRSLEFRHASLDETLEGAIGNAAELKLASRTAVDVCRMFGAYLSA